MSHGKIERDVEARLHKYLVSHSGDGEAYRFNIKMYGIRLPKKMEETLSSPAQWDLTERAMQEALEMFVEELMQNYEWISGWRQEGRSNGWLVLETNDPVLSPYGTIVPHDTDFEGPKDWSPYSAVAVKRLHDLDKIDKEVRAAKKMLLDDMSPKTFVSPAM